MSKEKFICDHCGKNCNELLTREGFCQTYFVEWVCSRCFKVLQKVEFEDYKEEDNN